LKAGAGPCNYGRVSRYRFMESKNPGVPERIPAFIDKNGNTRILHSLVSPRREAEKLIDSLVSQSASAAGAGFTAGNGAGWCGGGFQVLIILGLGGGWLAKAALEKAAAGKVLVIDYCIEGIVELLENNDYSALFDDRRFALLVDESPAFIEDYIVSIYLPAIYDGIAVLPLRARTGFDSGSFDPARAAIRSAIERTSADFSAQAYFGKRWFSNIIRNIVLAENQSGIVRPVTNAVVCAAGPLLDSQIEELKALKPGRETGYDNICIISTDTALGSLLNAGIKIDAIVSIDCQHTSLEHFAGYDISNIPLFLDLVSPPLLFPLSSKCVFFAGGHPLGKFISVFFKEFTGIDTSGANVTYAAVSLAEQLGAKNIFVFGADFAYPQANLYTKGAYFYPVLRRRESRFAPVSTRIFDFLFRNKTLKYIKQDDSFYYQTDTLRMYKQRLEEKTRNSGANITAVTGRTANGITVNMREGRVFKYQSNVTKLFSTGRSRAGVKEFLNFYRKNIEQFPAFKSSTDAFIDNLSVLERQIFITLLPAAAAFKRGRAGISNYELFEEVKAFCVNKIEKTSCITGTGAVLFQPE